MTTLKQRFAIISICFITTSAMAQTTEGVSIKSTLSPPHPSAMLDVESASKGILIPRVPLVNVNSATPVSTPTTGLLVYNTTTTLPDGEGFYFWDATGKWQKLASLGSTSGFWSATATGNSIHRGSIATQSTDGSTIVGIEGLPAGCQSEFYVNGPSTFFAADPGTLLDDISATAGIQIGAPWSSVDGGHWNEINTPDYWLDMQFNTGRGVNIGGGKGSYLNVYPGSGVDGVSGTSDDMSGVVAAYAFLTTSDSTKKKNITAHNGVLAKLNSCNTYDYNFKQESNSHKKHTGVLAQEIEAQFPTLVENQIQVVSGGNKFSPNPVTITTKAVDYAGLTAILLQALKEQQAQIEALKARLTVLENH